MMATSVIDTEAVTQPEYAARFGVEIHDKWGPRMDNGQHRASVCVKDRVSRRDSYIQNFNSFNGTDVHESLFFMQTQ